MGIGEESSLSGLDTLRGVLAQGRAGISTTALKAAVLCSSNGKESKFKSAKSGATSAAIAESLEIAHFFFNFKRDPVGRREVGLAGERATEPPIRKAEKVTKLLTFEVLATPKKGFLGGLVLETLTTS
jgi:hypothetical protein